MGELGNSKEENLIGSGVRVAVELQEVDVDTLDFESDKDVRHYGLFKNKI